MSRLIDADKLMMSLNDNFLANSPTGNETLQVKDYRESVCEGLEIAMATVEGAPTVGGWISVKDRLPESRHAVLVYTPHHKNIWAVSMHEDGNWYIWSPGGRVLLDPDWHGPITHWRPLPEPPKEE